MMGLPNIDGIVAGFRSEMNGFRDELTAIRTLLERLVELEEQR